VDCVYERIVSSHGHDSFLAEPDKLVGFLREFVAEDAPALEAFHAVGAGEQEGGVA